MIRPDSFGAISFRRLQDMAASKSTLPQTAAVASRTAVKTRSACIQYDATLYPLQLVASTKHGEIVLRRRLFSTFILNRHFACRAQAYTIGPSQSLPLTFPAVTGSRSKYTSHNPSAPGNPLRGSQARQHVLESRRPRINETKNLPECSGLRTLTPQCCTRR